MAIQGQRIDNFRAEYSENLLPTMNGSVVVTTGTNANITYDTSKVFDGLKSIKSTYLVGGGVDVSVFNISGYQTTIKNTGSHILSYRLLKDTEDESIGFWVNMYVNGLLVSNRIIENDLNNTETPILEWNCYAQSFELTAGDVITFTFESISDVIGSVCYLDGLKLEYDDRFLGTPSIYSRPLIAVIDAGSFTGWARYLDATYTVGSPLAILSGVRATLTNNAVSKLETQLPDGVTSFFNDGTQKILAIENGDSYNLSIRFKAKMSVLSGYFDIDLDIGGAQGIISQESILFTRGSGTEQRFDIDLTVFSGVTFVANGGTLSITPQNGDIDIYDISFVIVRTHKAK